MFFNSFCDFKLAHPSLGSEEGFSNEPYLNLNYTLLTLVLQSRFFVRLIHKKFTQFTIQSAFCSSWRSSLSIQFLMWQRSILVFSSRAELPTLSGREGLYFIRIYFHYKVWDLVKITNWWLPFWFAPSQFFIFHHYFVHSYWIFTSVQVVFNILQKRSRDLIFVSMSSTLYTASNYVIKLSKN